MFTYHSRRPFSRYCWNRGQTSGIKQKGNHQAPFNSLFVFERDGFSYFHDFLLFNGKDFIRLFYVFIRDLLNIILVVVEVIFRNLAVFF